MYRKIDKNILTIDDFILPFGGKLDANNRWVKKANLIPWDQLEVKYLSLFKEKGAPAKTFRMAFGALYIKSFYGSSDEETIQNIIENPYLQYFIGLKEYQKKQPFDSSTMVYFRKRITPEICKEVNELIINYQKDKNDDENNNDKNNTNDHNSTSQENQTQKNVNNGIKENQKQENNQKEFSETIKLCAKGFKYH